MTAVVLEVGKLLGVIADALAASIGVAALFSLAVLGITRASEQREHGNALLAYGALAVVCLLGCLAAAVYGIALIAGG